MKFYAISGRVFYGLLIVFLLLQKHYLDAATNFAIFIALLPLLWLAKKDKHYYLLDAGFMLLFGLPLVMGFFGYFMSSSIIGVDKVFHLAAGALLALFCVLTWEKHRNLVLGTILFVLGVSVLWEGYEWFLFQFNPNIGVTVIDSVLDLVADVIGGVIVLFISKTKFSI